MKTPKSQKDVALQFSLSARGVVLEQSVKQVGRHVVDEIFRYVRIDRHRLSYYHTVEDYGNRQINIR